MPSGNYMVDAMDSDLRAWRADERRLEQMEAELDRQDGQRDDDVEADDDEI